MQILEADTGRRNHSSQLIIPWVYIGECWWHCQTCRAAEGEVRWYRKCQAQTKAEQNLSIHPLDMVQKKPQESCKALSQLSREPRIFLSLYSISVINCVNHIPIIEPWCISHRKVKCCLLPSSTTLIYITMYINKLLKAHYLNINLKLFYVLILSFCWGFVICR